MTAMNAASEWNWGRPLSKSQADIDKDAGIISKVMSKIGGIFGTLSPEEEAAKAAAKKEAEMASECRKNYRKEFGFIELFRAMLRGRRNWRSSMDHGWVRRYGMMPIDFLMAGFHTVRSRYFAGMEEQEAMAAFMLALRSEKKANEKVKEAEKELKEAQAASDGAAPAAA